MLSVGIQMHLDNFTWCQKMANNLRVPEPLRVPGSNVADDWRRFRDQFENYDLAADLSEASQERRATA